MSKEWVLILALVLVAGCSEVSAQKFQFNSKLGVVHVDDSGRVCLAIQNANLKPGDQLSLVDASKPQKVATALMEASQFHSARCSEALDDPGNSFYLLKLADRRIKPETLNAAIAVIGSGVRLQKGVASIDLDRDGQAEYFRSCTSNEALHLTVWTGKPLVGRRRWHSYYYLGYDTVPTCKTNDAP
jgi:hypothetical protein